MATAKLAPAKARRPIVRPARPRRGVVIALSAAEADALLTLCENVRWAGNGAVGDVACSIAQKVADLGFKRASGSVAVRGLLVDFKPYK